MALKRADLEELHYICHVDNFPSIIERDILSYQRAKRIAHNSVAMQEVQDLRENKRVPGGLPLHDYVNLYFCARNPMLFKRRVDHESLCILRIDPNVLDLKDVDVELVFARYWTDDDQITVWRKKAVKCAEVLVPHAVSQHFISGAFVSNDRTKGTVRRLAPGLDIITDSDLFFC